VIPEYDDKKPWPEPQRCESVVACCICQSEDGQTGEMCDQLLYPGVYYDAREVKVIEEVIKLALWACRPVPRPATFYDEDGEINEQYLEFLDEGDPTSTTSQEFLYDALEALQKGRKGRNGDT